MSNSSFRTQSGFDPGQLDPRSLKLDHSGFFYCKEIKAFTTQKRGKRDKKVLLNFAIKKIRVLFFHALDAEKRALCPALHHYQNYVTHSVSASSLHMYTVPTLVLENLTDYALFSTM